MYKTALLEKSEEVAYEEFLDGCTLSSAQSSLDWCRVICEMKEDEPYFITAREHGKIVGVLPLYLYRSKLGNLLTTNAWHTISGITYSRNADVENIGKSLLEHSLLLAKELDCAILSVGTNPFQNEKECYLRSLQPNYLMENFVQYISLDEIFDENGDILHPNYARRTNLSRNLRRARLQQVTICEDQHQETVDQVFGLHERRMNELNAAPIPKKFFDSVSKNLTSRGKGKFLLAQHEGKMIGGCLFLSSKKVMDVYMMSMDSRFRRFGTNYQLTFHMLKWAHENGIAILHWMSSPVRGDGVYKWKEQWGSHERTFFYLTRVLDDVSRFREISYSELSSAYRFHYLLPFNLLKNPDVKFTTKNELTSFLETR